MLVAVILYETLPVAQFLHEHLLVDQVLHVNQEVCFVGCPRSPGWAGRGQHTLDGHGYWEDQEGHVNLYYL